jgi:thioredoxin
MRSALFLTALLFPVVVGASQIETIQSPQHLQQVLQNQTDKVLLFDLYADWCMPCKILSPTLHKLAAENSHKARVYKINVDTNPQLAALFGVRGIPYVVFVKNGEAVTALTGLRQKGDYQKIIDEHSS